MQLFNILFMIMVVQSGMAQSFKDEQRKFEKVQRAYADKYTVVESLVNKKNINVDALNIFIRAFKKERVLEVWGKNAGAKQFQLLVTYPFCAVSGELGPKRREGDGQIPEGVYSINHFNPKSNYFLSLGVSYPNRSDAILGMKEKLGGEIYIHGNCVTIGCIPITDDLIKELYILAVEARNNGQLEIPVHIFPMKLTRENITRLNEIAHDDQTMVTFWQTLVPVFQSFEEHQRVPAVTIDASGRYAVH